MRDFHGGKAGAIHGPSREASGSLSCPEAQALRAADGLGAEDRPCPRGCDTGDTSLSWPRLLGAVVWLRGPEKHGLKVPCCSPTVRQDGDMVKFNAVCDL